MVLEAAVRSSMTATLLNELTLPSMLTCLLGRSDTRPHVGHAKQRRERALHLVQERELRKPMRDPQSCQASATSISPLAGIM